MVRRLVELRSMRKKIEEPEAEGGRLLAVREVAGRLGVSSRQVWKLAGEGKMPAPVRLAGSVRWRSSDIDQFIESGCNMAAFSKATA